MSQMLLINPKRRRAKSGGKKRRTAAQRAATKRMIAANRGRAGRSANPAPRRRRRVGAKRRRNPIMGATRRSAYRRRRNPIAMRGGSLTKISTYLGPIKDAAVMGVGAIAVDVAFGYINPMLPVSMRKVPGVLGVGDAVKAVITVALGQLLKGATRGLSQKAAVGSLVVQARDIAMTFMPASVQVNGLGYVTAGQVVPGMTGRVNSNMRPGQIGAYTGGPGQSPLLARVGAYTGGPGQSPLLARASARRTV